MEQFMQTTVKSLEELQQFAKKVFSDSEAKYTGKPLVFLLHGDLGAGKTAFSKAIANLLGVEGVVTSPTFVVYNEYKTKSSKYSVFLHFDLYRISAEFEYKEIEFMKLFESRVCACIEWAERLPTDLLLFLNENVQCIELRFEYVDENTRKITNPNC